VIRRLSLVRKRPELTREEFLARWTGEHVDIAKRLPGLRGYVIHVLDGEAPPVDGIAVTTFDSREEAERAFADPELAPGLRRTRDDFAVSVEFISLSVSLSVVLSGLARYFAARPLRRSWSVSLSCRLYGALGRAVGVRAQALGVTVLGARRRGDAPCEDGVSSGDTWRAQLPQADFVVLTLPATPETRGILGEQELAAMKAGAWLINVARGSLVDEEALLDALASGHLGGAALDAFQNEPLPPEHPFWTLPNVLLSPHSSWRSSRLDQRDVAFFSDNLKRFIDGDRLRNVVDLDAGY